MTKVVGLNKSDKMALAILGSTVFMLAMNVLSGVFQGEVISLLKLLGIYNPPSWLAWTIWAAGSARVILGWLAVFGIYTAPAVILNALLVAGTVGA